MYLGSVPNVSIRDECIHMVFPTRNDFEIHLHVAQPFDDDDEEIVDDVYTIEMSFGNTARLDSFFMPKATFTIQKLKQEWPLLWLLLSPARSN